MRRSYVKRLGKTRPVAIVLRVSSWLIRRKTSSLIRRSRARIASVLVSPAAIRLAR
ncbi:hypothetical protein BH24CHL9_BH24CHL9_06310 [soil metagenome]